MIILLFQLKTDSSESVINPPHLTFTYYANTVSNVYEVIYWHLQYLVSFIINMATLIFSVTSVSVRILVSGWVVRVDFAEFFKQEN